jgi:hypothetical protein
MEIAVTAVTVKGHNMNLHNGPCSKNAEWHFSSSYDTACLWSFCVQCVRGQVVDIA